MFPKKMNKSSSARRLPPADPPSDSALLNQRRQSLNVFETSSIGSGKIPSISLQCSIEIFDNQNGANTSNSFIGRTLRDCMRELARPTMQLCLGSTPLVMATDPSAACPNSILATRRLSRSQSPSAFLLAGSLAQAAALQQQQQTGQVGRNKFGLCANRSPSVSGCSIAPGMGGRRGSEKPSGRLERSNSLLGGRGGGGSSHLPFLPELSPQQVANLRRSWKHVNTKGLYDVIRRAFRRVESSTPNARAAFRQHDPPSPQGQQEAAGSSHQKHAGSGGGPAQIGCGVMEHTRYFLALLDRIIDGDQEDAERELKLVGARHVPAFESFGLSVAELERLGEALAESFFKLDGIRQSKETTKVWRMLIAHIIDHIRDGFETELRMHRRRTSALLAAGAGGGGPAVMAMAPLESRFCKRNSVPSPRKNSQSSSSTAVSTVTPTGAAPPNTGGPSCSFLRTELANLTRKLSNL